MKYSGVIKESDLNVLVLNIKLGSDCPFAQFFRMAHGDGEDLYNSVVFQEEGVLLSCLFPSTF